MVLEPGVDSIYQPIEVEPKVKRLRKDVIVKVKGHKSAKKKYIKVSSLAQGWRRYD